MLKITDEMQRFLITTTFGYDIKAEDPGYEKLKRVCSRRAYMDLARVVPYKYSISKIDEYKKSGDKEQEINNFNEGKKKFIESIEELLINNDGTNPSSEVIKDVYSKAVDANGHIFGSPFTYGMAQKWVNMYFKYLWLFFDTKDFEDGSGN